MTPRKPLCIKGVVDLECCAVCGGNIIKHGQTSSGNQRFRCKSCGKTRVEKYRYNAYDNSINPNIVALLKEVVGIRSTARLLGISGNTVLSRIKSIASKIKEPILSFGKEYKLLYENKGHVYKL